MYKSLEQYFSDLYISNLDIIGEGLPDFINSVRREYLEQFNLLGIPGKQDERYRHFYAGDYLAGDKEFYFTPQEPIGDHVSYGDHSIAMFNGFTTRGTELGNTAEGVFYGSLREAARYVPEVVAGHYNSVANNSSESLTALNSVFMQDGAFVYVPDGIKCGEVITIDLVYSASDTRQMCFPRILIVAGKDVEVGIIVRHRVLGDNSVVINCVREMVCGAGSKLNLSESVEMNGSSVLFSGNYMRQEDLSKVDMLNVWFGHGATRVNAVTDLAGVDCDSTLYGLYLGSGQDRTDINMTVNHLVPDCRSYELVKGVVSGESVGAFTGKVFVEKDAQRTAAYQQSRNLQLSRQARIYTEPQLEIYADDVKCSHGATVGQLDDDAVYYMRQRGISEADAKKLQLSGFVNDILMHCPVEPLCDDIREQAFSRIETL